MKAFTIGVLAPCLAAALPADPPRRPEITKSTVPGLKVVPKSLYDRLFNKDGKLQSVLSNPPGVALPKSEVPEVQVEKSKVFASTTRKKIRYGPYRLPATSEDNWQKKEMNLAGMADEYHYNITKPCTECMVASLSADLEYADGSAVSSANAWLHHSAVVIQGPRIYDPVCGESNTETLFSSGNERSTTRFYAPTSPIKSGYHVRAADTLTMIGEYKSELDREQWVWLTLSWEVFDGPQPRFRDAHVVWLSTISSLNCARTAGLRNPFGESNLTSTGAPKTLTFSEKSVPWISPVSGTILGMGGHVHDGATSLELFQNGRRLCESRAGYSKGGSGGMGGMGHADHAGGEHVSSMTSCALGTPIRQHDSFYLSANYDFTKHEGSRTETGELDEVMGVGVILLIT